MNKTLPNPSRCREVDGAKELPAICSGEVYLTRKKKTINPVLKTDIVSQQISFEMSRAQLQSQL
jgi:hypothetical protein